MYSPKVFDFIKILDFLRPVEFGKSLFRFRAGGILGDPELRRQIQNQEFSSVCLHYFDSTT